MKKLHAFAVLVLLLALSSCLSTVHPIFTEKDIVFDQKLLGKWLLKDEPQGGFVEITTATAGELKELPSLNKLTGKIYMIKAINSRGIIEDAFFGFMVKIGNNHYLDYYPAETPAKKGYDDFYKTHYIRLHTAYHIRFTNARTFELKQLDESYLKNLIRDKKIRIRHETRTDGSFVVTAPTEELQQYLLKYGDVPEAYYQNESDTYIKAQ